VETAITAAMAHGAWLMNSVTKGAARSIS
jgi:hypothetical protein